MAGVSLGASSGRFRGSREGCGLSHQSLSMGRGRREMRSGPRGGAWTEGGGAGGRATGGNMAELAGLQEKLPRHTLGGVRAVLSAPMFRLFSLPFLLGTATHACFTIWFS